MGERYNLGGRVALAKGVSGGWWGDWELNYKDQMTFEEYLQWMRKNAAYGGRIGFHRGKSANKFESWLKNQVDNKNTSFRTAQDVFKAAGEKSHGDNQKIWNKYKDQFTITSGSRTGGNIALKEEAIKNHLDTLDPTVKLNVEQTVKTINKNYDVSFTPY